MDKQVLKIPLEQGINAVLARGKAEVPVVLQRQHVSGVIALMEGTPQPEPAQRAPGVMPGYGHVSARADRFGYMPWEARLTR
ncbi:MAG TPA: hypothetical protein VLK82_03210 [Candidatus Tectomicrobia bacterium]|nr:hypothetical protein [Candidatus Tectomicrobia bacterium]